MTQKLIDAALAVVARWESPDWAKVVREGGGPHTGELIHALRQAVETASADRMEELRIQLARAEEERATINDFSRGFSALIAERDKLNEQAAEYRNVIGNLHRTHDTLRDIVSELRELLVRHHKLQGDIRHASWRYAESDLCHETNNALCQSKG